MWNVPLENSWIKVFIKTTESFVEFNEIFIEILTTKDWVIKEECANDPRRSNSTWTNLEIYLMYDSKII